MVTFDRLPMHDVLVNRLGWSEADAQAFLDALAAPTEQLATRHDIAAVQAQIETLRAELVQLRADSAELQRQISSVLSKVERLSERVAAIEHRLDEQEARHRQDAIDRDAQLEQPTSTSETPA